MPSAPPPRPLASPRPTPTPGAHGQGRGPRGCGRRGRNPKWRFRASPGPCARPPARPPRRPPVDAPGGGARLRGKVWGLFLASRSCWGRGRRGGGAGPRSASSGLGTTARRVTAPSALGSRGRAGGRRGRRGTPSPCPGTWSAVILPLAPRLRERILRHHLASPAPPLCSAPNGFCFVFTISPQRITCQINFIFFPPPSSPLSPPPHRKPRSLRLDILQTIYVVFRIVIFFLNAPPPHGYSSRRFFLPFPRLGGRG